MPTAPTSSENKPATPSRWQNTRRKAFRWTERGLAIFGLLVLLYLAFFDVSVMVSGSMSPALQGTRRDNGDHILTEKLSKWFRAPHRWEIITFSNDEGTKVMKRVVGRPGETVRMESIRGPLLVNDKPLEMPPWLNIQYIGYGNLSSDHKPVECGDGYYVLGDDTKDSDDSRFNGPVKPSQIVGRAWLIVWPLSRLGFVK